jgi:hypothetical protein
MNKTPLQDLAEAVNSIISVMLAMIRANGLRSLIHLPQLILVMFLLHRIRKHFTALLDAHAAGTLPVAAPAPTTSAQYRNAARGRHRAPAKPRARGKRAARPVLARAPARPRPQSDPFLVLGLPARILVSARST